MACGLGHNAVFLANQGFEVCAVDFSSVALAQLGSTCTANDLKMELLELDLTLQHSFTSIPKANNIVVLRYKLKMEMMEYIPKLLKKNGVFLYSTFNQQHHQETGFPSKHCLIPDELTAIPWDMKLLWGRGEL